MQPKTTNAVAPSWLINNSGVRHSRLAIEEFADLESYIPFGHSSTNTIRYSLALVGYGDLLLLLCFMMNSILVAAIGLGLLAIASTPTVLTFNGKLKRRKGFVEDNNFPYKDRDGAATEESQKKFSTIIPRSLSITGSIIGCLLSIAEAILCTSNPRRPLFIESWLVFASWVG